MLMGGVECQVLTSVVVLAAAECMYHGSNTRVVPANGHQGVAVSLRQSWHALLLSVHV